MRFLVILVILVFWTGQKSLGSAQISCGIQKIKRPLILRGYDTYAGQFPWHVALLHRKSRNSIEYACGGSLISRNFVLTVAHCTQTVDDLPMNSELVIVLMGTYKKQLAGGTAQQHSVFDIHTVPKDGQFAGLRNDIALLQLSSRVEYTDYIQPICLNTLEVTNEETGFVVGWGQTEDDDLPDILKGASMPIISHIDCLVSNRDFHGAILDPGMICAGHLNGTGVATGDSGGGLVVERCSKNKCSWFLVGMVSFGDYNGYGVFVNVQEYLPWIQSTTKQQFEVTPSTTSNPTTKRRRNASSSNPTTTRRRITTTQRPRADWEWVSASNGKVPSNAADGGANNGMYICRAWQGGDSVPGKLYPPHRCCYIPWGGLEHCKKNYEVLVNANGRFVRSSGRNIPHNAYAGGYDNIHHEPLYIGRVNYQGTLTIGKVSRHYGLCYISWAGIEHRFTDYEIYVV